MINVQPRIVPPRGPEDSPFVIVGEAPGKEEIKKGMPFIGPSGQVLSEALKQLPHPEPYILNVVPHMIQGEKSPEMLQELVSKYQAQVLELVRKHPRKIVLALGNVALWALTNDFDHKITKVRGKLLKSDLSERGIVPTTHPAFLLRGNGSFRQFKIDVGYAMDLAAGGKVREFVPPTWELLDTVEKVKWFVEQVKQHEGLVSGDLETGGFSHRLDKVLMGGFTLDGKHVYVIPGKKREYIKAGIPDLFPYLAEMWDVDSEQVRFNWHNGKFDIKFFHHQYNQAARVDDDTMLMSYALDETRGVHDLETVAADWLHSPDWKGILDSHKKKNESYDVIPEPVLVKYMAYDIANTHNLPSILRPLIEADSKSSLLYYKTLIPGSKYLTEIEKAGMLVDTERVESNAAKYEKDAKVYEEELERIARDAGMHPTTQTITKGGKKVKVVAAINVNSPLQLKELFFEVLQIPSKDKSTNEKVLKSLPDHPAVVALRKYRKINKGLTTYVLPATEHIQDDGRVHQTYLLHGTATGRLACNNPNLQNIPREPLLRGQFIPKPGYCFIEVDLNQAELRSLAILSGDPELCRIYTDPNSVGLHEEVRAELYGYPKDWSEQQIQAYMQKWYTDTIERIVEEQKMRAKNVNFGIVYGITPFGLAEQIEDTPQEAGRMLAGWAKKFNVAWNFIQLCRNAPINGKNIVTCFGHKKRFEIVTPETIMAIQNEAANFPHQSTASTITLHGGMRIQDTLRKEYDTNIVNTVHDSILMEVPLVKDVIEAVTNLAINELEQVPRDWGLTRIPFKAEAKGGMRWGELKGLNKFYAEVFAEAA